MSGFRRRLLGLSRPLHIVPLNLHSGFGVQGLAFCVCVGGMGLRVLLSTLGRFSLFQSTCVWGLGFRVLIFRDDYSLINICYFCFVIFLNFRVGVQIFYLVLFLKFRLCFIFGTSGLGVQKGLGFGV